MSQARVLRLQSAIIALKDAILKVKPSDQTKLAETQEALSGAIEELIRFQTEAATKRAINGARAATSAANLSAHGGPR